MIHTKSFRKEAKPTIVEKKYVRQRMMISIYIEMIPIRNNVYSLYLKIVSLIYFMVSEINILTKFR